MANIQACECFDQLCTSPSTSHIRLSARAVSSGGMEAISLRAFDTSFPEHCQELYGDIFIYNQSTECTHYVSW